MALSLWQVQKAVWSLLSSNAGLQAIVGDKFYDQVPDHTLYPYVTVYTESSSDFSTFNKLGEQVILNVHTWSQANGRQEALSIMTLIDTLLNRANLTISGYSLVGCVREFQEVLLDQDGRTYHGVQRFRIWVTE